MFTYYYPFEVVKTRGEHGKAFLKASLNPASPPNTYYCGECNESWPNVCKCPTTEAEDDERRKRILKKIDQMGMQWEHYFDHTIQGRRSTYRTHNGGDRINLHVENLAPTSVTA